MPVDPKFIRSRLKKYERGGGGRSYLKLKEGKNVIRAMPFQHVANEYDVIAGRYSKEDIGRTFEEFFAEGARVWAGKTFRNCLPVEDECPLWIEFWDRWNQDKEKARAYRPRAFFALNVVDMLEPHRGVQVLECSSAVFLGERNQKQEKVGLGIFDYFNGYDPSAETENEDKDEDEQGQKVGVKMPKISQWGDKLLGLGGIDILVWMHKGNFGIQPNNERELGAVTMKKPDACDKLESHFLRTVKDLFGMPVYYPGFNKGGENLWKHADDFAAFAEKNMAPEEDAAPEPRKAPGGERDPDEMPFETEETEKATEEEPAKKPRRGRKPKEDGEAKPSATRIEKGVKVLITDKWNEDNTKVLPEKKWKRYVGVFERWDGEAFATVALSPGDQTDDERRAEVQELADGDPADVAKGGPFINFPKDCVTVLEG